VHPRRAPSTTPPLVDGRAPAPVRFVTTAQSTGVVATGRFAYDPTHRRLEYAVQLTGPAAGSIATVSIARDSAGVVGPIVRRLLAQVERTASGSMILDEEGRQDLLAGRLSLSLFAVDHAGALVRAPMLVARGAGRE